MDERRRIFHKMNFKVCPSCWSGTIQTRNNIEGCRPSGDVYGYTKFSCLSCLWSLRESTAFSEPYFSLSQV